MEFSITMAAALLGSVGTICLTVLKIVTLKKNNKDPELEVADLKQQVAVQKSQIDEMKNDIERLQTSFDKINDLLINFLSSN